MKLRFIHPVLFAVLLFGPICGHCVQAQEVVVPPNREDFHIFLLIGQSNMAGRGAVEEQDVQIDPRVLSLDPQGNWVPAVDPLHHDKPSMVGVGPGRAFALDYAEEHPGVTVGLVPSAAGGSAIDAWQAGGFHAQTKSHPYDEAITRAKLAQQAGVIRGFLWHQGESDSKAGLAEVYEDKLADLIDRLRTELDAHQAPFLIGQIGNFAERPWDDYRRMVDRAQQNIAMRVPFTTFVSSDGLQHKGDQVHFDSASARELGHRYFRALMKLQAAHAPRLISVNRIWDRAKHNAFTDLVRFNNRWFCVFREGAAHVSPDGALRVLSSMDGQTWKSAALITSPIADLRDAKISVTPSGQLMLSGAGAMHDASQFTHQSMSWFSDDGEHWSDAWMVGERDYWLWRTTWHRGQAYGVGYRTNATADRNVRLYRSSDGKSFETIVENLYDEGYPNESSLVFLDDDRALCLLRRDAGSKTGLLGSASPPYTDWQWQDLEVRIGGPHMLQLPDGRFVAAVRLYDGRVRTALCWLDTTNGKLTEFLALPSGGDTSYAGLVWHDDHLYVSYYSGHEANDRFTTAIYFAKVKLD
jgi:hypothetical protein